MRRYNIILLVDASGENVLMCSRSKPPYQGLLNLVGGKAEAGESGLHSAYRELREETGITAADVSLAHVTTFTYPGGGAGLPPYALEAYAGRLRQPVEVRGEENPLCWVPLTDNFFDLARYAGEGSIGHVLETVRRYRPEALEKRATSVILEPLAEAHLPALAFCWQRPQEELLPMLAQSAAKSHEGRYYEQFALMVDGCVAGLASLYAQEDGAVSDGIEVFPTFRRCGFGKAALDMLAAQARDKGYRTLTAQVRTDNAPSLALHQRAGFTVARTFVNRKGNEVHQLLRNMTVRHEMSLRPKPFAMIASGEKTYELRLHDEKRRLIRVGDELLFTCTADERTVLTRVNGLCPFPDFAAMYAALPLTECGYRPDNVHLANPRDMEAYYPPERQAESGVLAIALERVRFPLERLSGMYEVRELTDADVPEMLRVAQGNPLYYEHMRMQPDAENIAETLMALPPRRTLADKQLFGWFDGSQLVALMDLIARHPQEDMAFIGWFMVDAEHQGAGLGRKLVADVLSMLHDSGIREVRLGRVDGNPQSERFWRACGFADTELGYNTQDYHVTVMRRSI